MEFKVGDKVRFKSGGPVMIVEADTNGNIRCGWFDKTKFTREVFLAETLESAGEMGELLSRLKAEKE